MKRAYDKKGAEALFFCEQLKNMQILPNIYLTLGGIISILVKWL